MTPLRIAMLAHSTNPRGGVVYAMCLSEALSAFGVEATLHAPDATGAGFFRAARCRQRAFRVGPQPRDTADMVEARIADYVAHFRREANRGFDLYHAHDGISGAALAILKREGLIPGFARTVHHLDAFADPRLADWQTRSIREADALMVVSETWRRELRDAFGREATVGGAGVARGRFSPRRDGREAALRARFGLRPGPVFLAVGGVEARKNTLRMLIAFGEAARAWPHATFLIAGGASLLDHGEYQSAFRAALAQLGPRAASVKLTGPLADEDMPALYRLADALTFASVKEGFGLCVLEAMASGTPVVVSRIAPFTEYLGPDDALFCDPYDPAGIASAMQAALNPATAARLRAQGLAVAARHDWAHVAARSLDVYRHLREPAHA